MSNYQKYYVILWLCSMLVATCGNVEAQEPLLVADEGLVGNVYGWVTDKSTGKPLAGTLIALLDTPLQPAEANDANAFRSNKGWFHRPDAAEVPLQTLTDDTGKFLINSVPTPYPFKLYSIVAQKNGYDLLVINQARVVPGAVMSLKANFALTQNAGLALVYSQDDENVPVIYRHEELVMSPEEVRGTIPLDGLQGRIFATREGLVGHTTANGHVIRSRDRFVALPSRRALCSNGGDQYQVRLSYNGKTVTAPVWDVGPWNTKDDYWNSSSTRERFQDLAQGKPEAQAAYLEGYNGGRDMFGRRVANPAGIDLADGIFWDDLKLPTNTWIDVEYLWGESGCSCTGPHPELTCTITTGATYNCRANTITLKPGFYAQAGSTVTLTGE